MVFKFYILIAFIHFELSPSDQEFYYFYFKQYIRKISKDNPDLKIVATGCSVQTRPEEWSKMPEVYKIFGNTEKLKVETWKNLNKNRSAFTDIMKETETNPFFVPGFKEKTRAFLQIQQGCDHRCTFCIIPFGRGNSRSVDIDSIINNAQKLIDYGHKEIVLTGVDITSWGKDCLLYTSDAATSYAV